jgi:HSP20 family molecular chaperone IbpA
VDLNQKGNSATDEHGFTRINPCGFLIRVYLCASVANQIPLPQGADTDKVRAEFANGELKVSIPVPQGTASRREMPIQSP